MLLRICILILCALSFHLLLTKNIQNWILVWQGCYSVSETDSSEEKIQIHPKGVEQDFFFCAAFVFGRITTFSSVYSLPLKFTVTFLSQIIVVLTSLMLQIEQFSHLPWGIYLSYWGTYGGAKLGTIETCSLWLQWLNIFFYIKDQIGFLDIFCELCHQHVISSITM